MAPMYTYVPNSPLDLSPGSNGNVAWPQTLSNSHSQAIMPTYAPQESTVLNEKSENFLPPFNFTPVNLHKENRNSKPDTSKTAATAFVSQNHDVAMADHIEISSDSEAEHDDIVTPTQKRKRRTNNSLNDYLDAGGSDLDIRPPSKRIHHDSVGREPTYSPTYVDAGLSDAEPQPTSTASKFTPLERGKGVLVGVWKDSPYQDPAKKHAVWGFLDSAGHIRRKIMTETRDGERTLEGNPIGTGRAFISPDGITLEPHLSALSNAEQREYIRIRAATKSQNEPPEERRKAEELAVLNAKVAAANNPLVAPATANRTRRLSSTPVRATQPASLPRPKGFVVGYWKHSNMLEDADKNAVYGVVDGNLDGPADSVRLRVKVSRLTRDQRKCPGNFPDSTWIPYESLIHDPLLADLNRLQLTEYVRIRHVDTANGTKGLGNWIIDPDTIESAKKKLAQEAAASGLDLESRNAEVEFRRTAQYKNRAAVRATGNTSPTNEYVVESPKSMTPIAHMHSSRNEFKRSSSAVSQENTAMDGADTRMANSATPTITANPKSDATTPGGTTTFGQAEKSVEKPMAKRSNRADARARQEKLWNKTKDFARDDGSPKVQTAEKNGMPTKRRHTIYEQVGIRSDGLANDSQKSTERTGSNFEEPWEKKQDVPLARAETVVTASGETKIIKFRLDKDAIVRTAEKVDGEARADVKRSLDNKRNNEEQRKVEEKRRDEIKRSGEKRKATEMQNAEEESSGILRKMAERDEERRKRATEQRKAGEKRRIEEMQARVSDESEGNNAERELPLVSPAAAEGNPVQLEASTSTPGVKWHDGMKYERRSGGTFAGKLVSDKSVLITIDGEDYVEYRILMRTVS